MILVTFPPMYVIHTLFFELGLKAEQDAIKYILYLTEFIFHHEKTVFRDTTVLQVIKINSALMKSMHQCYIILE